MVCEMSLAVFTRDVTEGAQGLCSPTMSLEQALKELARREAEEEEEHLPISWL